MLCALRRGGTAAAAGAAARQREWRMVRPSTLVMVTMVVLRALPARMMSVAGAGGPRHLICVGDEATVHGVLQSQLGIRRGHAEELCRLGAVYWLGREQHEAGLDGGAPRVKPARALDPGQAVRAGDYVRVHPRPKRYPEANIDWEARIVHECEAFVVVDKPRGVPCQPTLDNVSENVLAMLGRLRDAEAAAELRLPHRLDVDTSGVLVVAKSKASCAAIGESIKAHTAGKMYVARVRSASPHPPQRLVHLQLPSKRAPHTFVDPEDARALEDGAKRCEMEILGTSGRDLRVRLITGRTHQIRGQLAAAGMPIEGDELYGAEPGSVPLRGFVASPALCLRCVGMRFALGGETHAFRLEGERAFAYEA